MGGRYSYKGADNTQTLALVQFHILEASGKRPTHQKIWVSRAPQF